MWKVLPIALLQSALLALGQALLKYSLEELGSFSWSRAFFKSLFTNWHFALCGLSFGVASLLWFWLLKHFPLSVVYPLLSMSYVMGMLAANLIFHESIPLNRWIGLLLIMVGVILVVQK